MAIIYISLFIIGSLFGSFYCCIANRLSKNESIVTPGSHCENCNHRLTWYELIPIFSFIIQGGKCRKCKIKLSYEYLIVEIVTGLLFMLSFAIYQFSYSTLTMIVLSSLLIITYISDFKYMVILDEVLIPGIILLIVILFFQYNANFVLQSLLRGLVIFGLLLVIKLIGDKVYKQESLGWGDVKLSFIAGLLLGFKLGLVYLFVGALIALPYGLILRLIQNDILMPFGPFLITSLYLVFIFSPYINRLLSILLGG
jgi:prepilin signal peptidase PulO-like enzyme (type II secretory pathway)